jgi:hypothetical protein
MLQRLEVNRAVGFLLLSRGWQFLSGIFTVALMTSCLDERTQGVYQLFLSLVGMQLFVELGLPGIVSLLTSHEWSRLEFDSAGRIVGDLVALGRLASIYRFASRWFAVGVVLFLVGVCASGYYKISGGEVTAHWLVPWVALVAINAIALPFAPRLAMLEGCHQVATINYFRLLQAVSGTLVVWAVLYLGGGLWALSASSAVKWGWEYYLVRVRYRSAFVSLSQSPPTDTAIIIREIWPLLWRSAIQAIGLYFCTCYFTIVVSSTHGTDEAGMIEAGRFGLTWGILQQMHAVALSWVNSRMPEFGALAARGEHDQLRRRLLKTGLISIAVFLAGAGAFVLAVLGLVQVKFKYASRFLDLTSTSLLVVGLAFILLATVLQVSVRLYKQDPFLFPNLVTSIAVAILAWKAGERWGSSGVGLAYVVAAGGWSLPVSAFLAWRNQQQLAHAPHPRASETQFEPQTSSGPTETGSATSYSP